MSMFWPKLILVLITAAFAVSFVPLFRAWHGRSRLRELVHPKGAYQYMPHVAMLVHSVLTIFVLLSINPLPFLPDTRLVSRMDNLGYAFVSAAGLLYYIAANIIRYRAVRELRQSFEKEVVIKEGHELITSGFYQYFRHPIYVANILAEFSIGLTLLYWPLIVFPLLISFPLWHARARKEEQMLIHQYPYLYRNYIGCVKRWGLF